MPSSFPIRQACPPGACCCKREELLDDPQSDTRILMLTREEEKKLVTYLEAISNLADLQRMRSRMQAQLGIELTITPSTREVRSARGISIKIEDRPGLCRKTLTAIPAAIRRSLDRHPEMVYAILNAHDLLSDT